MASAGRNAAYPAVLKAVFDRRILSPEPTTATAAVVVQASLVRRIIPFAHPELGNGPLIVQAASQARQLAARAAANAFGSLEPPSSATSARAFVEDLFRRRKVDFGGLGHPTAAASRPTACARRTARSHSSASSSTAATSTGDSLAPEGPRSDPGSGAAPHLCGAGFLRGLVERGEAAHPDLDGKLPPGAAHEIIGEDPDDMPIIRRRQFKSGQGKRVIHRADAT